MREPLGQATLDVRLQPGDFLYVPRGQVHEALMEDTLSLHISVLIQVVAWADLLHQAVDDSARGTRASARLCPQGC
jgi:ribosomal protein L16 Arg81 hydroxylase